MKIWFEGENANGTGNEGGADGNNGAVVGLPDDFDFSSVLPDDLKADKSLEKFSSHKGKAWVENVLRSQVSAQKMIGANPDELMRLPTDPTKVTPEDKAKVMARLGFPKEEKAWELKAPEKGTIPGMEPDGKLGKWFSKSAQAAGIFPADAQKMYEEYVEVNRQVQLEQVASFAAMDKQNVETLQKELGPAFDGEIKAATFGAQKLGGNDFVKRIGDMGLGTDPIFVKAMAKYGRAMAEGSNGGDKGDTFNSGKSPAQSHAEATALLREAMGYMDSNPGRAKELNQRAQEIFARAAT